MSFHFDVTARDVCVPDCAKKVPAVPAWLKRQAYAENGITQYKTGDYEVDQLIPLSLEAVPRFTPWRTELPGARGSSMRHKKGLLAAVLTYDRDQVERAFVT